MNSQHEQNLAELTAAVEVEALRVKAKKEHLNQQKMLEAISKLQQIHLYEQTITFEVVIEESIAYAEQHTQDSQSELENLKMQHGDFL